jgi:hypothetical protein
MFQCGKEAGFSRFHFCGPRAVLFKQLVNVWHKKIKNPLSEFTITRHSKENRKTGPGRKMATGQLSGSQAISSGRGPHMLPDPAINRRATVICPSGTKNLPKKQEALIFVPSGSDPLWRFGELPGCSCDQVKDEPMNPLGTGQRLADFALRKVLVRIGRSNIGPVPNDLIPNDLRCGKRSAVGYWTCPHRVFFAPGFSPNRDVFGRLSSSDRVLWKVLLQCGKSELGQCLWIVSGKKKLLTAAANQCQSCSRTE